MSFSHLFRYGRTLYPATAAAKAGRYVERRIRAWLQNRLNAGRCTYPPLSAMPLLAAPPQAFATLAVALDEDGRIRLQRLADNFAAHRFNLLGSGWVEIRHGMACQGFDGHRYNADFPGNGDEITARLSPGNRRRAAEIRAKISADFTPIDWHLDFRSGYRWREDIWSKGIPYGHEPGVDVKLPWELARLQHLPMLALAARLGPPEPRERRRQECRDQILDFIAANPPGYGVNWHCTMDVAMRAANMAMTHWLLASDAGAPTAPEVFERELTTSLLAHGRHIMANLEDGAEFRGNHYLADVCGLAFTAAALAPGDEAQQWWRFALREIIAESHVQFGADGANREGSTSYHRLSAEMLAWTVALVVGRDGPAALPADFGGRLLAMAMFSQDATKPDGRVVQIGDNDSGRFFKLGPGDFDDDLTQDALDHGALPITIAALLDVSGGVAIAGKGGERFAIEHAICTALAGSQKLAADATPPPSRVGPMPTPDPGTPLGPEIEIVLPDATILEGLAARAYPDFGLYIWKSPRFFMSLRCGAIGQNGRGGHDHNDQLALELQIDGIDWVADPGSYVYSAAPELRDAYRSVTAHAAPRLGDREPASLGLGMFRLEDTGPAQCLSFDIGGFAGFHQGFGTPVHRAVRIEPGRIRIRDATGGSVVWESNLDTVRVTSPAKTRQVFDMRQPFSPGYGLRHPD